MSTSNSSQNTDRPRTEKPVSVLASPEVGEAHYTLESIGRPLSLKRLAKYEDMFERGIVMLVFHWAIATLSATGQVFRINGQHTSRLMMLKRIPMYADTWVSIEEYVCKDMSQVYALYAAHDSRICLRTNSDVFEVYAKDLEIGYLPKKVISLAATSLGEARWGVTCKHRTREEKGELLQNNQPFVLFLNQFVNARQEEQYRVFGRLPVAAAMAKTYIKSAPAAIDFWEGVRAGSGPSHAPTRMLHSYLKQVRQHPGKRYNPNALHVSTEEIHLQCLQAWKAAQRKDKVFMFPAYANIGLHPSDYRA